MAEARLLGRSEPIPIPAPAAYVVGPAEIGALLRRNWLFLLACGFAFAAIAYFAAKELLPPLYTASGMVAIDTQSFAIPSLQGALKGDLLPDPMPMVRSEVEVLQSPELIRSVVRELKLDHDPEFNGTLKPQSPRGWLTPRIASVLPQPVRDALPVLNDASEPHAPPSPEIIDDITVSAVAHRLAVKNDGQSMVITIQFTAQSPRIASAVVNSLIRHYMAGKQSAHAQVDKEANSTLNRRIKQVRDEVAALEQKIQTVRQQYGIVQTRAGSVGQQELEDLSSALVRASADRAALEADYARASQLAHGGRLPIGSAEIMNSPTVSTLREREASAERHLAELLQTYGSEYPTVKAAKARLASAHSALAAEIGRAISALRAQVMAARQREATLKAELGSEQAKVSELATVQGTLAQLQKDADARRALYQSLLVSAEQTETGRQAPRQTGSHVVSLATPPAFPASPRPKLAASFGMVAGFAFGGLIVLVRGKRGPFSDAIEIGDETGLKVVGTVPHTNSRRGLPLAVVQEPSGAIAESCRALRTRLRILTPGSMPRTVLFASSIPGEGAPSVAAAFATAAALDRLRVLLVECDLRKPSLARLLNAAPSNGTVNALLGYEHWRDAVLRDPASGLDYLLAGQPSGNAGRLLESMQLKNLVAEAKETYNFVLLDAPPVSAAPDAIILAPAVDVVLLVVKAHATPRDHVQRAIGALAGASPRPPGLVLNNI